MIAATTGKVVVSVYSGAAIGRLVPDDVVVLVRYLAQHVEEAVPLWDNVLGLASFPGFAELKRSLRERPQLASFQRRS